MRRLEERNAQQWIVAVKAIRTPSVRAHVAAVILFDWLYDAEEPWKRSKGPLVEWAGKWTPETCPSPPVLAAALVRVGYPPTVAEQRAWVGE